MYQVKGDDSNRIPAWAPCRSEPVKYAMQLAADIPGASTAEWLNPDFQVNCSDG
jgi:hypothetical protein